MSKRVVRLLLGLAAVIVALSGSGNAQGVEPASVSAAKLKPYNLLWYMRGRGAEKDQAMVEEAANRYLKDRINATIRIVNFDRAAYESKMAAIIASGEPFDMCFSTSWTLSLPVFAQRGAFVALNDPKDNYMDKYMPRTKELLGPFFLRGAQINGVQYGIPVNKEHAGSFGYLLRKDIIDKYKLDVSGIKSWEDLEPLLKAVKQAEPLMSHPFVAPGDGAVSNYENLAGPVVVQAIGGDTRVYDFLELPDVQRYFKAIRRFYQEDLIRKDAATTFDWVPDVTAGKIFAIWTVAIPGADTVMENETGMPWYQVNLTPPIVNNSIAMGGMNAISITSKDPARAAMFTEIINTDKYLNNLINFGIEGVHYVKVSDNVIRFAPRTNDGRSSGYNPGISWAFANQRLNYFFENEDPDKWAKMDAYGAAAVAVNSLGFFVNEEPIRNELAALSTASQEYIPGLEVGALDPAVYVPLAIAKYKACGIDKVIAEVQKQYDAWRAATRL